MIPGYDGSCVQLEYGKLVKLVKTTTSEQRSLLTQLLIKISLIAHLLNKLTRSRFQKGCISHLINVRLFSLKPSLNGLTNQITIYTI